MTTRTIRFALAAGIVAGMLTTQPAQAIGYGDTRPRVMGLAGTYTAMARGVESLYWNPANLALKGPENPPPPPPWERRSCLQFAHRFGSVYPFSIW